MARPSKQEIEKRNKILNLGFFKRDNEVYTNFENNLSLVSESLFMPYYFCDECHIRTPEHFLFLDEICNSKYADEQQNFANNKEKIQYLYKDKSIDESLLNIKKLSDIDENIGEYYYELFSNRRYNFNRDRERINTNYISTVLVDKDVLIKALGKKRIDEFTYCTTKNSLGAYSLVAMINGFLSDAILTDDEKIKIKNELIKKNYASNIIVSRHITGSLTDDMTYSSNHKKILAELDLSKPIEEIVKYVTQLKTDFDNKPSKFPNAYELLGESITPYKCDLKDCEIYKEKNPKPIYGRLADVLFIYDCKKMKLTNEYITDEINRYWQEVKKISTDGFYSLEEYYKIAKEHIDNKKYIDYLVGVEKPPL